MMTEVVIVMMMVVVRDSDDDDGGDGNYRLANHGDSGLPYIRQPWGRKKILNRTHFSHS